jgi:hypothetical protein
LTDWRSNSLHPLWVRFGAVRVSGGSTPEPVSWHGAQIIIEWLLWLPGSFTLMALGAATAAIAFRKEDALLRQEIRLEREAERRRQA